MAVDEPAPSDGTFALPLVEGDDGPMARVHAYPSGAEAHDAARTLIEHGIGATVVDAGYGHELRVVPEQGRRAAEVLGFVEPDPTAAHPLADGEKPPKVKVPVRQMLLLWLAGLILIPLVAGVVSYWLVSRP